jgi:predicted nucleic acid-binding protein
VIVVDSSVWIGNLKRQATPQVGLLGEIRRTDIIVGDVVVAEVLRGLDLERDALTLQQQFEAYGIVPMLTPQLAITAAGHYRALRRRGITIRMLGDMIIGTFCLVHDHYLLHQDRDFDHFERHLGLKVIR